MSSQKILKIGRTDTEGFVLISTTSNGAKPLDLKLLGTDNEAAYVAILRQDRIASLKASQASLSEDEWRRALEALFQLQPQPDVSATAAVDDGKITITLRKEVQGFTQRLGAVVLDADDKAIDKVDLFEWCSLALDATSRVQESLQDTSSKQQSAEAEVKNLKSQLDELVTAKNNDETILLHKFRDLLNEKKVKIREQQKIIAASTFRAPHSDELPAETSPAPPARKPAASRAGKRKAPPNSAKKVQEKSTSSDDEMDVDVKQEPEDSDPGNTTEATASTASDDEDGKPVGSALEETAEPSSAARQPSEIPARRNLPFNTRKPATQKAAAAAPTGDDSETDDEL